jgi:hypothetical protein
MFYKSEKRTISTNFYSKWYAGFQKKKKKQNLPYKFGGKALASLGDALRESRCHALFCLLAIVYEN